MPSFKHFNFSVVLIILLFLGGLLIFIDTEIEPEKNHSENNGQEITPLEISLVEVNNVLLKEGEEAVVVGDALTLKVEVEGEDIEDNLSYLRLDGFNLLSEESTSDSVEINKSNNTIKINFLIQTPIGRHELTLGSGGGDSKVYPFILGLDVHISETIESSDILLRPETTKETNEDVWNIRNGTLVAEGPVAERHPSVALLYPVKDVGVAFEFMSYGVNPNFVFYFLDSGKTFILGNGAQDRFTFSSAYGEDVDKYNFKLIPEVKYSAYISRRNGEYRLYIIKGKFDQLASITEENLITKHYSEDDVQNSDSVGFSVWPGSSGFEISAITIYPRQLWQNGF